MRVPVDVRVDVRLGPVLRVGVGDFVVVREAVAVRDGSRASPARLRAKI